MKVMILAAGRGERLRPLTDHTPKTLIDVLGKPLVAHQLSKFAEAGFTEIVMNVSYLAEKIIQTLGNGNQFGVNIEYSFEKEMLETGGGIVKALPLLGNEPFIVISTDILTDFPFETLLRKLTHLAHLVMIKNPHYHPYGDFALEEGLLKIDCENKLTFGNIGIYHPELFKSYPLHKIPLSQILKKAILKNKITGELFEGAWENIGTMEILSRINEK